MKDLILSETLLADLYQSAVMECPQRFQQSVLDQLDKVIGFDRAWWGILSRDNHGFKLLSSFRHELPAEFEAHWQSVSSDDALASDVHLQPRTTIHYNQRDLLSTPGLASLNTEYNLRQALCTSLFLPDNQSFLFISLFRSGWHAPVFNAREIEFKQLIIPHVYACWRTNLIADIERSQGVVPQASKAAAFVDRSGSIICAHTGFTPLASEIWPGWDGSRQLPAQVLQENALTLNVPKHYRVERRDAGGLFRVEISRSSLFSRLTRREQQIAYAFAQARSYKHISLELALTPATVRYYIQTIYLKLNLHNKAELVKLVEAEKQATPSLTLNHQMPDRLKVVDYLTH
jgi:DNA-binding CsgD family transcriptional regulator